MSNDEDIENDLDDFDDGGFEELNRKGTLADLWRNNPFVKVAVIIGAFVFIIAGIILFGGSEERTPTSRVTGAAQDVTEAPGSSEVSEVYRQAIEETNQVATEEALRNESSAIPMPVTPALGVVPQSVDASNEEDPLDRWRRMQEERMGQQQLTAQPAPQQEAPVDTRTPAVNALSQAMARQMESVLSAQGIKGSQAVNITSMSYLEALRAREQRELEQAMQAQQIANTANSQVTAEVIVPAGTIEYAQLITEANTDAPGPVLAEIASGPLRGSRVLGSFSSTDKYLTLNFNMVVVNGVSQSVNAVALDPNTTLPGMVTDIDNRYFKRVVLPAAAAFVEGLTSAIADSGRTTVTISGAAGTTTTETSGDSSNDQEVATGIEQAGETISEIFDEEADNTRVMLKIASGTPIGILFMQPVMDRPIVQPAQEETNPFLPQQQPQPFFFVPFSGAQGQAMNYTPTGQQQNVGSQ